MKIRSSTLVKLLQIVFGSALTKLFNTRLSFGVFLVLVLILRPNIVEAAQPYIAHGLPGYYAYGAKHPEYHSDGAPSKVYERLTDNTIIYATSDRISGIGIVYTIYVYDLNTQKSTLLSTIPWDGLPYWRSHLVQMERIGATMIISIAGKLLSSDGTRQGTQEIGSFGSYYSGGTLGFNYTNILLFKPAELDRIVYFRASPNNTSEIPDATQVWRTDGTKAGTWPISPKHKGLGTVFAGTGSNTQSVYYFTNYPFSLRRILSSGVSEVVRQFDTEFSSPNIVRTRKGAFFCKNRVSPDFEGELWRLSNAGTLDLMTLTQGNCKTVFGVSQGTYFDDTAGLWFSNGHPGDKHLVIRRPDSYISQRSFCSFEELGLLYVQYDNQLYLVEQSSLASEVTQEIVGSSSIYNLKIENCMEDRFTISYTIPGGTNTPSITRNKLFNLSTGKVHGLNGIIHARELSDVAINISSVLNQNNKESILVEWFGMPMWLSLVDLKFLPSVLFTILDDESE